MRGQVIPHWRRPISYSAYVKRLCRHGLSSSLALGLVITVVFLIAGDATVGFNLSVDFGRMDGLWFLFGLPVVSVLVLAIVSPLSFLIHRQLPGTQAGALSDDNREAGSNADS